MPNRIRLDSTDNPFTKQSVDQLAICGGRPAFEKPLHVGRPNVVNIDTALDHIRGALERAWLTNDGQLVQTFESRLASYLDVRHCVATCNGTAALQVASRALEMAGEVIMPSLTFVATPHALAWQEVTPVFADVDPETWTLCPRSTATRISPLTGGILGVHLWGQSCDVEGLARLTRRHRVPLLFDASHALGCTHRGRPIGNFGAAETVSFHATKFINCAEGGAVLTNDDQLADRLRSLRNFGFRGRGSVPLIGTNAKMSEISAAIGLASLDQLEPLMAVNHTNHAAYVTAFRDIPGVSIREFNSGETCNDQYVVLELAADLCRLSRDDLVAVLRAENILARRYFYPGCHRLDCYRAGDGVDLPATEEIVCRVITLPTGIAVDKHMIRGIASVVAVALSDPTQTRRALRRRALAPSATHWPRSGMSVPSAARSL